MDWLAWLIGACCLLASVALPIAISERSSSQATPPRTRIVCASSPDWFRAIHRSYGCNPKITPQFDFTALYAPASAIEVGGTDTRYAQRCGDAARRDRGTGGGTLPLRARTSHPADRAHRGAHARKWVCEGTPTPGDRDRGSGPAVGRLVARTGDDLVNSLVNVSR
jgi:hypothetical protein